VLFSEKNQSNVSLKGSVSVKTFRGINRGPPGRAGSLPFIPRCLDWNCLPCFKKCTEGWRREASI